jgi:hypothetical protein
MVFSIFHVLFFLAEKIVSKKKLIPVEGGLNHRSSIATDPCCILRDIAPRVSIARLVLKESATQLVTLTSQSAR